jgi:hypothetical protein
MENPQLYKAIFLPKLESGNYDEEIRFLADESWFLAKRRAEALVGTKGLEEHYLYLTVHVASIKELVEGGIIC